MTRAEMEREKVYRQAMFGYDDEEDDGEDEDEGVLSMGSAGARPSNINTLKLSRSVSHMHEIFSLLMKVG
jgi:hypothetical protein